MTARERAAALCLLVLASCNERREAPSTGAEQSPNAAILPAPLASTTELETPAAKPAATAVGIPADSAGRLIVREPPPPPPQAAPATAPLPPDTITVKDGTGVTLSAAIRFADLPAPAAVPEAVPAAIREAASKAELRLTVDLAPVGRMRIALDSAAFPLPANAELRARTSLYGHALVWPNGMQYRVLSPGSLRATFGERRADVVPVLRPKVTQGEAGSVLGHKTIRTRVETTLGTVTLEQAQLAAAGAGGELLCRFLSELVGADPASEACHADRTPLAAQYRWEGGGSLSFVVSSVADRKELPTGYLSVPPAGATFTPGELPPPTAGVFFTLAELTKFRSRPARVGPPSPRAPGEGITARNSTPLLQYLLLDGVPVAWIRPGTEQYVIGPQPGRYAVSFRDFFGTAVMPSATLELPTFVEIGSHETDAGPRPN